MPAAADLVAYSAASVPEDDTSTSGGARSSTSRPDVIQLTANAVIAVVSDGADTRTVTVTGRLASGAVDTEVLTLNGTTEVVGAKTFERILKLVASATSGTRTVTVRQGSGGATRATIRVNETTAHIFFQRSASESGATTRYEKLFWRNNHASQALTAAKVRLTADPSAKIQLGLATAVDDTGSVANRKTAPASVTFVDDGVDQNVPGTDLAAVTAIGVWIRQDLLASDSAYRSSFTTQLSGTSV